MTRRAPAFALFAVGCDGAAMRALRLALAAVAAVLVVPASAPAAEVFAGLTDDARLIVFQSDSPGAVRYSIRVTGLQTNERLVGLDTRRLDGRVYALGTSNRLYVLNLITGQAVAVNAPFSPPLEGTRFAFAAQPGSDEFHSISDTGQHLRIAAATGQVTTVDARYVYAAGDVNEASAPNLGAIGFTNPQQGASATTLYGIDAARTALVQAPDARPLLRTIGPLGVTPTSAVSLDFTTTGPAYAALVTGDANQATLYTVDTSTGAATPATEDPEFALIASRTSAATTREQPIVDMAALGGTPDDEERPRVSISVSATQQRATVLRQNVRATVTCSEACRIAGTLRGGGETFEAAGDVPSTAGSDRLVFRLSAKARARLRAAQAPVRFALRVTATDAAGHAVTQNRSVRVTVPEEEDAGR